MHVKKWLLQDLTKTQGFALMAEYLSDHKNLSRATSKFYICTYDKFVNSLFSPELEEEMKQALALSEARGIPVQNYGVLDNYLFVGCDNHLASKIFRVLRHFVRQEHYQLLGY